MTALYQLKFTMRLAKQRKLLVGTLELRKGTESVNLYQATSSLPGSQFYGSWRQKGGLIPPSSALPPPSPYTVTLLPIAMPNLRGVRGGFYQILPFEQKQGAVIRGDFGIHRDADADGTLGCIGLRTQRGYMAFNRDMAKIRREGIERLFLDVSYT